MRERLKYPSISDVAGKFLDVPLRRIEVHPQEVTEIWIKRLSKLTNFYDQLYSNTRWQTQVFNFFSKKEQLCAGLYNENDPRSNIYTAISAYLSDPEMRQAFLKDIDSITTSEGNEIITIARKQNKNIPNTAVVIVGSGLHGTIAGIEMQAYKPDTNILYLDGEPKRGGGFRSYTKGTEEEIPLFDINSRHNLAIPLNRNDVQPNSPAHLGAISGEAFPSQELLASVIAVNNFLSGKSIQGAFVEKIEEFKGEGLVRTTFAYNQERFTVLSARTLVANGLGKTHIPIENPTPTSKAILAKSKSDYYSFIERRSNLLPNILTNEDFLRLIAVRKGEIFQNLAGRKVIVVGAKDSAQSILKLLSGYGRREAYEGYSSQLGRPDIYWMIPDIKNIKLRPQHESLRRELGDNTRFFIHPIEGYAVDLQTTDVGIQLLYQKSHNDTSSQIQALDGDIIIYCTGYSQGKFPEIDSKLDYIADNETQDVIGKGSDFVYIVGPGADLPLTSEEIKENPIYLTLDGNSNAMRRLGPKTRKVARHIASDLLSK